MRSDTARYRGADRRAPAADDLGRSAPRAVVAAVAVLAATAVVVGPARSVVEELGRRPTAATEAVALLIGLGLACSAWFHWRATGIAAGAWLAGAAVAMVLSVGADLLALPAAVAAAVAAVAGAHLVLAATTPKVDTAVAPHRVVGCALLAAGVVGTLALLVGTGGDIVIGLAAALWLVAGVVAGVRAVRDTDVLLGWMGVAGLAIGVGELCELAAVGATVPDLTVPLLQSLGLGVMGLGTSFDLARVIGDHRDDRLERELSSRVDAEHRRIAVEDRNHDLGNALMALEGAAVTLARFHGQLSESERDKLIGAVSRGAAEVRRLTRAELEEDEVQDVDLRELVEHQVTLVRAGGAAIEVWGADQLWTRGRPAELHQVVQNLLVNAVRHGGVGDDQVINVSVTDDPDGPRIVVIDDGPGVPEGEHDAIFERGVRRSTTTQGDGLGLSVARRIARRHGGDVVSVPSQHGARFELRLPVHGRDRV